MPPPEFTRERATGVDATILLGCPRERDDWDETLALLGELGLEAPVSLRQLEGKAWEIRVEKQRIAYVVVSGPELILLRAFKKQGRRTPRTDLDLALKRAREVLGETK